MDNISHASRMAMGLEVMPQKDICPGIGLKIDLARAANVLDAEFPDPVRVLFVVRFDAA